MDLSSDTQKAILKLIGVDCFNELQFKDAVKVTTKITILVDELTEYEYDFDHTFNRNEAAQYKIQHVDNECQTDTPPSEAPAGRDTLDHEVQTDALDHEVQIDHEVQTDMPVTKVDVDDDMALRLEVKVEQDSDVYDDDNITMVTPESPQSPTQQKTRKKKSNEITCPLCPAKFHENDVNVLEEHVKLSHDIGNVYICPICQHECNTKVSLAEHVTSAHCKAEDVAPKTSSLKSRKSRARIPQKIVDDDDSDTDEGYLKKECLNIKIKKSKIVFMSKNKKTIKNTVKTKPTKPKPKASKPKKVFKPKVEKVEKLDNESGENPETEKDEKPKKLMEDKSFKSKTGEVKCIECGKEYKSRRALRRHFNTTHEDKEHMCEICGHSFRGKESLYHHKRGVHENLKVYKCPEPGCEQSFNFSHSLRLHRLKHSGARPHMCNLCGKTYLTAYHLKVHMQATHSEKKHFSCKVCNKLFSYSTSLKMHEATHNKGDRVKCESCDKTFVNQQALKYHIMSKHAEPGHFPCDECGKICKTDFLLRNHKKRHTTASTRFMCDICGRQYMYKSALDMHRAIHKDEKSYVCKICDKSFKTYPTLYSHQYVHRQDSPYTCQSCGKSFKTKERLKAHEKRHSGLKPYKCVICHHCFPDNGGLSKHMRTVHCKVKKFICDICGKATSRADNLRVHMKVHNKGTEYKPKQPRESKQPKLSGQNMPSHIPLAFDMGNKKSRAHDEFFDDNSEDSHSNSGSHYTPNGYEPSMPHFATMDTSQIVTTSSDQNMPLNLMHPQGHSSQGSVGQVSTFNVNPNDHDDRGNRGNPVTAPPSSVPLSAPTGAPNNLVSVPALQPSYMYTWPYVYPPGIQPQSGGANGFFQQ